MSKNILALIIFLVVNHNNCQWTSLIKDDLSNWEIKQGNAQFK